MATPLYYNPWVWGAVAFLFLFLHSFLFIFTSGSKPGENSLSKFIHNVCSGKKGLMVTVLTWGYYKASLRRFFQHYRLLIFPQPKAKCGCKAPDALLVDPNTNETKSLVKDFIDKVPKGIPLVLNMGSYT